MQNNGQNDKDLFSDLKEFKSRAIIFYNGDDSTDDDLIKIMQDLRDFHERIEQWFLQPEQPTKGRLKIV